MLTEAILRASREACALTQWPDFPDPGEKNKTNIALLIGLLDATQAIARAVYDNSVDDNRQIDKQLATQLCAQSWNIARVIVESSQERTSAPPI